MTAQRSGRIAHIEDVAAYPPSSLATDEVHLIRAFKVLIDVDPDGDHERGGSQGSALAPGANVDVTVQPCRAPDATSDTPSPAGDPSPAAPSGSATQPPGVPEPTAQETR